MCLGCVPQIALFGFSRILQGEVASRKDLVKAFQTDNQEEIVKIILKEGQLQVSDLERKAELEM